MTRTLVVGGIPVRLYKSPAPGMDDKHELTTTHGLNWLAYDVFVWYGAGERDCIKDVPRAQVDAAIKQLEGKHSDAGVVGVVELGINEIDASFIAQHGIGVH